MNSLNLSRSIPISTNLVRRSLQSQKQQQKRPASTSSTSTSTSTSSSQISTLVQSSDYSSYLAHYFYPRNLQPHYLAIRAFNSELASVKDSVSSEILGRIRIGWWRDAIAGAYDVSIEFRDLGSITESKS